MVPVQCSAQAKWNSLEYGDRDEYRGDGARVQWVVFCTRTVLNRP